MSFLRNLIWSRVSNGQASTRLDGTGQGEVRQVKRDTGKRAKLRIVRAGRRKRNLSFVNENER